MLGVVHICACTSGELLVRLLLSKAVAMEKHNSAVICPLLLPLGPVSTSLRQITHVHTFDSSDIIGPCWILQELTDSTDGGDSLLSSEPLFTSVCPQTLAVSERAKQ